MERTFGIYEKTRVNMNSKSVLYILGGAVVLLLLFVVYYYAKAKSSTSSVPAWFQQWMGTTPSNAPPKPKPNTTNPTAESWINSIGTVFEKMGIYTFVDKLFNGPKNQTTQPVNNPIAGDGEFIGPMPDVFIGPMPDTYTA